jgi:heme oxygenase
MAKFETPVLSQSLFMSSIGPVLVRLRLATTHAHQTLEDHLKAIESLSSAADRQALVARYYRMHTSADSALGPWLGQVANLDQAARQRTPQLVGDMSALGLSIPPSASLPHVIVASVAEALGFLYVLEGSSLGGRVIAKGLRARGVGMLGLSFLEPYGDQVGVRWKSFVSVLERDGAHDLEGVVRGALAGFRHAAACLLAPQPVL